MKNILAKIVLWGILLWGGFALIRHLFHRICHQYKPTKILGHKKLWSDKCEMMGRKISYYVQKNMVLWAEKYDIMGRKRAERSLGGCSSPLSHLSTVFPLLPPQSNRGSQLINLSHFVSIFEKWQSLLCWLIHIAKYFPNQHHWILSKSNRGSWLINLSHFLFTFENWQFFFVDWLTSQ